MDDASSDVASSDVAFPASLPIPIDLFGSKKHKNLPRGELGFVDSAGDPVFRVVRRSRSSSVSSSPPRHDTKSLLDAAGDPVFSVVRGRKGLWQIFKVDHGEEKELICNVQRTRKSLTRTELEVLVIGESCGSLGSSFTMRGFPFQKSCTVYQDAVEGKFNPLQLLGSAISLPTSDKTDHMPNMKYLLVAD